MWKSCTHVRLWLDTDMPGMSLCPLDEVMLCIVDVDNVALCTALGQLIFASKALKRNDLQ